VATVDTQDLAGDQVQRDRVAGERIEREHVEALRRLAAVCGQRADAQADQPDALRADAAEFAQAVDRLREV
jgi:hypothetical protein